MISGCYDGHLDFVITGSSPYTVVKKFQKLSSQFIHKVHATCQSKEAPAIGI
jgi:hypothetical protein